MRRSMTLDWQQKWQRWRVRLWRSVALIFVIAVSVALPGHMPRAQAPDQFAAILQREDGTSAMYLLTLDGQTLNVVSPLGSTPPDSMPAYLSWSPDGSKLAVAVQLPDQSAQIYTMDADGSDFRQLTDVPNTLNFDPQWSPDSTRIAFISNRIASNITRLYVMNADGSDVQLFTPNEESVAEPRWSPDGTHITYQLAGTDGTSEIYKINTVDLVVTRLTISAPPKFYPQWSADGSQIYYVQQDESVYVLYVMGFDGADPRPIYALPKDDSLLIRVIYSLAAVPNGRELLYIQNDVRTGDNNQYQELRTPYLVNLTEGFLTPLSIDPQYKVLRLIRRNMPADAAPPDGEPTEPATIEPTIEPTIAATIESTVAATEPSPAPETPTLVAGATRLLSPTPAEVSPSPTNTPIPGVTRLASPTPRPVTATLQVTRFVSPTRRATATQTASPTITNTPSACTVTIQNVVQQSENLVVNYRYDGPPSTIKLTAIGAADPSRPQGASVSAVAPSQPNGSVSMRIDLIREGAFTAQVTIELCGDQRRLNKFGQQILTLTGEKLPVGAAAESSGGISLQTILLVGVPALAVITLIAMVVLTRRSRKS